MYMIYNIIPFYAFYIGKQRTYTLRRELYELLMFFCLFLNVKIVRDFEEKKNQNLRCI